MKIRSSLALILPLVFATAAARPVIGHPAQAPARATTAEASTLRLSDIHAIDRIARPAAAAQMPACSGCHGPGVAIR